MTELTETVRCVRSDPNIIQGLRFQGIPPAMAPMLIRPFELLSGTFVGTGVSVELWELVGVRVVVPEDVLLEKMWPSLTSGSPSRG